MGDPEHLLEELRVGPDVEARLDQSAGTLGHPDAERGVIQHALDRVGERLRIFLRHHESRVFVDHDLRNPGDVRRDARRADRHGLEQHFGAFAQAPAIGFDFRQAFQHGLARGVPLFVVLKNIRQVPRDLLALGLLLLLAFAVRARPLPWFVDASGQAVLRADDAQYHARLARYSLENFPAILTRDSHLDHPDGAHVPWPPLWSFSLAAAAAALGGGRETLGFVLAWAPALLGALSLIGLLIKNAIVLIEEIDQQIADGKEALTAILDSTVSRLRPVVMAASTTILGLIPLLQDVFFVNMSITIMAGLGFATFLTLLFVPVLYSLFFKVAYREDA